jgi:hypothetical protein
MSGATNCKLKISRINIIFKMFKCLFNDAVHNSNCIPLNDLMIREERIRQKMEGSGGGLI